MSNLIFLYYIIHIALHRIHSTFFHDEIDRPISETDFLHPIGLLHSIEDR
jgi:hypothetical protein